MAVCSACTQVPPRNVGNKCPCRHPLPKEAGANGYMLCPHPPGRYFGEAFSTLRRSPGGISSCCGQRQPQQCTLMLPDPSLLLPGITAQINYLHPGPFLTLCYRRLPDPLGSTLFPARQIRHWAQQLYLLPLVEPAFWGEGKQLEK